MEAEKPGFWRGHFPLLVKWVRVYLLYLLSPTAICRCWGGPSGWRTQVLHGCKYHEATSSTWPFLVRVWSRNLVPTAAVRWWGLYGWAGLKAGLYSNSRHYDSAPEATFYRSKWPEIHEWRCRFSVLEGHGQRSFEEEVSECFGLYGFTFCPACWISLFGKFWIGSLFWS